MTKRAYTLAEVLITLGIIGVVAALTISVLSHNIQKYGCCPAQRQYAGGL